MALVSSFNILHISDIHYDELLNKDLKASGKPTFHDEMKAFIVSNFDTKKGSSQKIDYLLITGDFGDKCDDSNVAAVIEWLVEIKNELKLESKQIILTPGNHDLVAADLPERHQNLRIEFDNGRNYVVDSEFTPNYNHKVFRNYELLKKELLGTDDYRISKNGLDVIDEDPRVRFITANSSWLSQYKKTDNFDPASRFVASMKDKSDKEAMEALEREFSIVCSESSNRPGKKRRSEIDIDETPDDWTSEERREGAYKNTLNYSENTNQQLALSTMEIDLIRKVQNDKLNILIFHHPENHLHVFERNIMEDIQGSGHFDTLSLTGHVLICGHIHPRKNIEIMDSFRRIPAITGGSAQVTEKLKATASRPLFFSLEFSFGTDLFDGVQYTDSWWCEITQYLKKTADTPIKKYTQTLKTENNTQQSSFPIRKRSVVLSSEEEDIIQSLGKELKSVPVSVSSENQYRDIQTGVKEWLYSEFCNLAIRNGIKIETSSYSLYSGISEPSPYYKLINFSVLRLCKEDMVKEVLWDVMFSCELSQHGFIQNRIKSVKNTFIEKKAKQAQSIDKDDIYYVPIIVDLMGCLAAKGRNIDYMKEIIEQTRDIQELISAKTSPGMISSISKVLSHGFALHNIQNSLVAGLELITFIGPQAIKAIKEKNTPSTLRLLPIRGIDFIGVDL